MTEDVRLSGATAGGSPRRVAVVHGQLTHGGSERQLYLFLRECDPDIEPHLFVSGELGVWADPIRELGVSVTLLTGSPLMKLRTFRREYRRRGLDGFVSWSSYTNVYGLALAGLDAHRVGSFRNAAFADLPERGRALWSRLSLAGAEVFVCNSPEATADVGARLTGGRRAVHVPNAVEVLPDAAGCRRRWRERLGVAADDVLVVGVGRLAPQKNFPRFVDVIAEVSRRHRSTSGALRAVIAGPDLGEGDALAQHVADVGMGDRVRLLGPVPEARELIASADVFLLSSDFEGMPNVVLEAISLGVPVVSTPVHTVAELLGDTGRVPGFGAAELAHAITVMLDDREAARRAAERARTELLDRRSPAAVYRDVWQLVREPVSTAVDGQLVGGRA